MASNTNKKIELSTPLQYLKGVGPAKASAFARKGITKLQDALYYFPRRYEDRRHLCSPKDLATLPEGIQVTVLGRIERHREIPLRGRKQTLFEMVVMGESGDLLTCTWFSTYKGMKEKFAPGTWAIFQGALKKYRGAPQIVHPDVEILKAKPAPGQIQSPTSLHWGRIVPIYSRSEKLSQKFIREIMRSCLDLGLPLIDDLLPLRILEKYKYPKLNIALEQMHFPKEIPPAEVQSTNQLPPSIRRLIFEEFFKFQLLLLIDRSGTKAEPSTPIQVKGQLAQHLRKTIPYKLTNAQEKVIKEVLENIQKPIAMNRIVQGDVGSGKTFVAFFAAAEALENGMQVALMAPTEILAEQHYLQAKRYFESAEIEICLLTGSLKKSEKEKMHARIGEGKAQFVIGTHALIQEAVQWKNLGLVIIDEQHRFGVRQRTALKEKTKIFPHILTMTATPIPRSLALTVFGELDVSTIDELPPGRQEILTKVIKGAERNRLYNLIKKEADEKRQSYIVYPLVADSEKEGMEKIKSVEAEYRKLKDGPLAGLRVAMVHGQMTAEERNQIMRAFKAHEFDVLLSTTVIEVGVDVPNATVMAIENAERFGLSQLHQLRGRVGRGAHKSFCVLVTDSPQPGLIPSSLNAEDGVEDESPWVRLLALEKSRNGFEIAEQDLKLRGPGDFFGTKQSGSPTFQLADLSRDAELLETARAEAQAIFQDDPNLEKPEHKNLGTWFHRVLEEASIALKSG